MTDEGTKNMRKKILLLFIVTLAFFMVAPMAIAIESPALAAILIDSQTGKVLYQKNAHQSLPCASTTKILTALIALEQIEDLDTIMVVPDDFINPAESSIWLEPGERHNLIGMLYAMMLRSANDAASVIAINVGGTEEDFVRLMNQKMTEMSLKSSVWKNPHGLHDAGHYSSAYDLAMITREAFHYPVFNEIISARSYELPWPTYTYDHLIVNRNSFISSYSGGDGVKTGTTTQAGSCLVASATRDGMRLIGVLLNCENIDTNMADLMDYGFANFSLTALGKTGDVVGDIKVKNARIKKVNLVLHEDAAIVMDKDSQYTPRKVIKTDVTSLDGSVFAAQPVGTITYSDGLGNDVTAAVYPEHDLERYTLWIVLGEVFNRLFSIIGAE